MPYWKMINFLSTLKKLALNDGEVKVRLQTAFRRR